MPSNLAISKAKPRCTCPFRRFGVRSAVTIGVGVYVSISSLTANAGDILRGGTSIGAKPGTPPKTPISPAQEHATANAREALARTTQAMQAMRQMQASARTVALRGPNHLGINATTGKPLPKVPNGLVIGGLQVAPGVPKNLASPLANENPGLWTGAQLPKQKTEGDRTTVTIKQTESQAVLNWKTFNVGKKTTVDFNQKAGTEKDGSNDWIAFNKISDPSGVPSQILGDIKAEGSVYLINPNGILFGGSSQVNLRSLVASSLPINDALIGRQLNNPAGEFLFSAPRATDPSTTLSADANTYTLAQRSVAGSTPTITFGSDNARLIAGADFTTSRNAEGATVVTFTQAGRDKVGSGRFTTTYFTAQGGDVVVQKGALLAASPSPENVGRISLVGPNVRNDGTILTPDGQTILAAGLQVGFTAHAASDPTLRGLDTYIGAEGSKTGKATNAGLIEASRANVTIASKRVQQLGAIHSTTSVALNGRIDLLADYDAVGTAEQDPPDTSNTGGVRNLAPSIFLPRATGTVTLGPGSVTQVLPELGSDETVVGTKLALTSQINIQGRAIHLAADSLLLAPNANVTLNAGRWKYLEGNPPKTNFVNAGGQIHLDRGAMINVAGSTGVAVPVTQNILSIELRGSELADSPLQREGLFRGLTIQVDARNSGTFNGLMWVGTPLADVTGFVNLIERTAGELTTAGGTVKLNAGGSVVMQGGSTVDVSGGWIDFDAGMVQTTRVVLGNRVLDIAQVTPDLLYNGIYTGTFTRSFAKYGITETFTNPLRLGAPHWEESYTQGANGGSITISAPAMALDGELLGHSVAGPRQREIQPAPSALSISFSAQDASFDTPFKIHYPTPPKVVFTSEPSQRPAAPFALNAAGEPRPLSAGRVASVRLSPKLLGKESFGTLTIDNHDGDIFVPANVSLTAPAGGAITLSARNVDIRGDLAAPGGTLSFGVFNISQTTLNALSIDPERVTPPAVAGAGIFTLGRHASISTAALIVDDRWGADDQTELPFVLNGGSITINSFSSRLAAGSVIDASGGAAIGATNSRRYGTGGSISIVAGKDPQIKSVLGGDLELGSTLRAFSAVRAGALTIQAPFVQIGGTATGSDALVLAPGFFNEGGFGSYTMRGLGAPGKNGDWIPAIAITRRTTLNPIATMAIAVQDPGDPDAIIMRATAMPEGMRTPVSLTFNALGVTDEFVSTTLLARGDFVMRGGSSITTDALGAVTITGNTADVLGSIKTPGGAISIGATNNGAILQANPTTLLANLHIGSRSVLSTAGKTVRTPDARGFETGFVVPGGSISVSGNIIADRGSVLDVSGASEVLDFRAGYSVDNPLALGPLGAGSMRGSIILPARADSSGGVIVLDGDQALFTNATLRGAAGGPSAFGGSLVVSSDRFKAIGEPEFTPLDVMLTVAQRARDLPQASGRGAVIGNAIVNAAGEPIEGQGYFAINQFHGSGVDTLTLSSPLGAVGFSGPVRIGAARSISVADGGVMFANSTVNLTASHVALGKAFEAPFSPLDSNRSPFTEGTAPFFVDPTFGAGKLRVRAQLIDIGNLSLQGIGRADFMARHGDIRGNGTLSAAGHISLEAGQIYPPSAVSFTVAADDYQIGDATRSGSVTIRAGSSVRPLPLSAAGELNIYASTIAQHGTLRAPLGTINIGWDGTGSAPRNLITGDAVAVTQRLAIGRGSITSVSAIDPATGASLLVPFGINVNDSSLINPAGTDITSGGLPVKSITLGGVKLVDRAGSVIDIRGGGDLLAYRFVEGIGGTRDILASPTSFAVLPGYGSRFAPFAPFNSGVSAGALGGDPGFVNPGLQVGDSVYLGASDGLSAGTYTLLPARYALLPGAFLVTPQSGAPVGTHQLADGASIVSGYRFNSLSTRFGAEPLNARFEVASRDVVLDRAEYRMTSVNKFLSARASSAGNTPRLPIDAGHLIFSATEAMTLNGTVLASAPVGARGGLVDIATVSDIVIGGPRTEAAPGTLVLSAERISRFGAESVLIGGFRDVSVGSAQVTVTTDNLTLDNAGSALSGAEVVLVSNEKLTLAPGAEVKQRGIMPVGGDTLLLGDAATPGSGDGTLLLVSSDPAARIVRRGLRGSDDPEMIIGGGARIAGKSIILDSTFATSLDSTAKLRGDVISLNSGQISLQLDNPGELQPTVGLVLAGRALAGLENTRSLSLLSYSSVDIYGSGEFSTEGKLALHAAEIRGFNSGGGTVRFTAPTITLDNSANGTRPGALAAPAGTLAFDAGTMRLGANVVNIDQFADVAVNATGGMLVRGNGGLAVQNALTITAPIVTTARAADHTITAGGALVIEGAPGKPTITGGLGGSLAFDGLSIVANGDISLPSGSLTLRSTAGDLIIGGELDAHGASQQFHDLTRRTDGGTIHLVANGGSVNVTSSGTLDVAADGEANAGSISISAPSGSFNLAGEVRGTGGAGGTFGLDVATVSDGSVGGLNSVLNEGGFMRSRSIRIRTGDVLVDGLARSRTFKLSADQGAITVTGTIDASGRTGGEINLLAAGSVTLTSGSLLTTAAEQFSNAGKGGAISLEAGAAINGVSSPAAAVDLQTGSTINLSVATNAASSQTFGQFTGTLHLRAPQNAASSDVQIAPINALIVGASSIVVEGYRVFVPPGGNINAAVQESVRANGELFAANTPEMSARLLAANAALEPVVTIVPGAELINPAGDLTLGSANSSRDADWNLSTFRFGPKEVPGVLTLRASGNLVFFNTLSDGFATSAYDSPLLAQNGQLPLNAQSYSYRLTAGADFGAADFREVLPMTTLGVDAGSLLLGKNYAGHNFAPIGQNASTRSMVQNRYQVIRTGSGDIHITAGRDVKLLNQFATIFTAGTQVADATVLPGGSFEVPIIDSTGANADLGAPQQNPGYPAQYALAGGNITINAGADIARQTRNNAGELIADSSKQLPNNWLYRRGFVNPSTGEFGRARFGDIASTTWWIDYSNFFEGVGALGGGDVTLIAGNDVSNVDAVAPTNARMPIGRPNAASLLELGGGDLMIRAGHDIDGGVYYVERGRGTLSAGNSIHTNITRSPSLGDRVSPAQILPPETWLATTLFVGKGSFDVTAAGDLTLGPVSNPFLLPGGINNSYWYKTFFSTYAPDAAVNVRSLGGTVTLRTEATIADSDPGTPTALLQAWLEKVQLYNANTPSVSFYQPWLRLNETSVSPFQTVSGLMPPTLRATAFSGNINLVGDITLTPAPRGTIDLLASGSINALQPNGRPRIGDVPVTTWGSSQINLSDADPNRLPGITSPLAYQLVAGTTSLARRTGGTFLLPVDALFQETGSTSGEAASLQRKQALHGSGLFHAGDPDPIRLYANGGSISGLTTFSGKAARVIAGRDVTDIALYLQNTAVADVSVVAAGRDIIAFNANSPLRIAAQSPGNTLNRDDNALAGDLQISGPGTLEVLAGRTLDLGAGATNPDGTGTGLTSIGNARNPNLPFEGASIVAGAGIGLALGLADSRLDFDGFLGSLGREEFNRYLAEVQDGRGTSADFDKLPAEQRNLLALEMFYRVLRDAGRGSAGGSDAAGATASAGYEAGYAAIDTLFGTRTKTGDILTQTRDIRTRSGGSITLFAPGGELALAPTLADDASQAPPGVITEAGGDISIFTRDDVDLGVSRIFTLRGGDIIIWSSEGDIAAGSSSKTVQSAPPTRVIIDAQTGNVTTDLAGLATGGGIGVLATVEGVEPGDVDLIAPRGIIDAGDAGIRSAGNLNVAATQILNASNIQVAGSSGGVPSAPSVAAPNLGGLSAASNTAGAASSAATEAARQTPVQPQPQDELPSIISVEVIGYGGGSAPAEDDEEERRRREREAAEGARATVETP